MESLMWSNSALENIWVLIVKRTPVGVVHRVSPYYWMAQTDVTKDPVVFLEVSQAKAWVESHWKGQ